MLRADAVHVSRSAIRGRPSWRSRPPARSPGPAAACLLLEDCLDPSTGEASPVTIVTDNGPAYKSTDFPRFIAGRAELAAHVRTRHHAPETNGVVERFNGSLKYEHLHRLEIPDALALSDEAEAYHQLYNAIRPHEALDFATPLSRYLDPPAESHLFGAKTLQES